MFESRNHEIEVKVIFFKYQMTNLHFFFVFLSLKLYNLHVRKIKVLILKRIVLQTGNGEHN